MDNNKNQAEFPLNILECILDSKYFYYNEKENEDISTNYFPHEFRYMRNSGIRRSFGPLRILRKLTHRKDLFSILEHTIKKDNSLSFEKLQNFSKEIQKAELLEISKKCSKIKIEELEEIVEIVNQNFNISILTKDKSSQSSYFKNIETIIIEEEDLPENITAIFILNLSNGQGPNFTRFVENGEFEVKVTSILSLEIMESCCYILEN